jgi:protein involved in sex pheromone biosynthesis
MKKITVLLIFSVLLLTSCATSFKGYTTNGTVVNLEKNNFEVINSVSASSTAKYILGFGANKKNGLISEAKVELSQNAKLNGKPRALANEVVEVKTQKIFFGLIVKATAIVTADVVEFK